MARMGKLVNGVCVLTHLPPADVVLFLNMVMLWCYLARSYTRNNVCKDLRRTGGNILKDDKDLRIDVDYISIQRESVGSMFNRRRSDDFCYLSCYLMQL